VVAKPDAKILDARSSDFWKVIGRKRPANGYIGSAGRKGESLVDVINDAINKAKALGYDAISIGDADIGTVILNENAFHRATPAAPPPASVAPAQPTPAAETGAKEIQLGDSITVMAGGREITSSVQKIVKTPVGIRYQADVFGTKLFSPEQVLSVQKKPVKSLTPEQLAAETQGVPRLMRQMQEIADRRTPTPAAKSPEVGVSAEKAIDAMIPCVTARAKL